MPIDPSADSAGLHDGAVGEPVVDGAFRYRQDTGGGFFRDGRVGYGHGFRGVLESRVESPLSR